MNMTVRYTVSVLVLLSAFLSTFPAFAFGENIKTPDGSEIKVYVYKPAKEGVYPGVIVLHHAGGLTSDIKDFSNDLSKKGFVVMAIDFDTGSGWRDENVFAAYGYLQKLPIADARRIAFVGFSKGARIGLEIAIYFKNAYPDKPIRAFVSYYLGNTLEVFPTDELPPLLFLHGAADPELPGSLFVTFCEMQTGLGGVCEAKIYDGTSHAFTRDTGLYGEKDEDATRDAFDRSVNFLNKHLKNAPIQ